MKDAGRNLVRLIEFDSGEPQYSNRGQILLAICKDFRRSKMALFNVAFATLYVDKVLINLITGRAAIDGDSNQQSPEQMCCTKPVSERGISE